MLDLFLKLLGELEKCFKFADTVSHHFEASVCKVKLSVHVATLSTWSGFTRSQLAPYLRQKDSP